MRSSPWLSCRGITWDEDNIDYCEKNKDSTMKIDEPPTPFSYYDLAQDECAGTLLIPCSTALQCYGGLNTAHQLLRP